MENANKFDKTGTVICAGCGFALLGTAAAYSTPLAVVVAGGASALFFFLLGVSEGSQ